MLTSPIPLLEEREKILFGNIPFSSGRRGLGMRTSYL